MSFSITQLGIPAITGIALGVLITRSQPPSQKIGIASESRESAAEVMLPDDPEIIRIAALSGRTTEARAKIHELLAAGAKDEEIAGWLAVVLFSDPAWLDRFILTVPEDRRIGLTRLTLMKIAELQPDAAWELVRASPYAQLASRSDVEIDRRKGVYIFDYCTGSPLAADTILDPSLGFSDDEIVRILRFTRGEENARRILEEWKRGRWKGEAPEFVRNAWANLSYHNTDLLHEIEKSIPPELQSSVDQFNALRDQEKRLDDSAGIPGVEELSKLGPGELAELFEEQSTSGTHIPLATLTQLPPELRKVALENYFQQDDTFHPEMARQCVEQLDHLDLTPAEKQSLLEGAASISWEQQGDYLTALEWTARMPDATGRTGFKEKLLTDLAHADPQSALEYIASLPAGELRDKIERIATDALP